MLTIITVIDTVYGFKLFKNTKNKKCHFNHKHWFLVIFKYYELLFVTYKSIHFLNRKYTPTYMRNL